MDMVKETFHFDTHYGSDERKVNALYCSKLKSYVYTPKVERSDKGPYEFGDKENNPMPKQCDIYDEEEKRNAEIISML